MPRLTRRRWFRMIALWLVLVIVAALLGARLYFGRDAEDQLRVGEQVDFAHLELPARDNVYLLCPAVPPLCNIQPDAASPVFAIDPVRLRDRWLEMVAAEPRVRQVASDAGRRHLVFIQHSAFFRFPDVITVEFLAVGQTRSTLAVLSRSRYGQSDFGVNAARVQAWVGKLRAVSDPRTNP
jgi:uncharacterized protein (DUF1499 family)